MFPCCLHVAFFHTYTTTLRVTRRLWERGRGPRDTSGTPAGQWRDTSGTPNGAPDGTQAGNRRTPVKRNICLDFAQATEESFLSPAHAARSHARTKRIPGRVTPFHFDLTHHPPIPLLLCLFFYTVGHRRPHFSPNRF